MAAGGVGEYDVSYSLPCEGRYRLWLRVLGRDIRDSPWQVTCLPAQPAPRRALRSYSASLPRPGSSSTSSRPRSRRSTPGRPARPSSANSWASLGSRTAADEDLILAVGSRGRGRGEFTNPQGVAVTQQGEILVCDSNTQCVQVGSTDQTQSSAVLQVFCSRTGQFVRRWGARGRQPGQLQRPTGLAVLQDGRVAVSDYDNKWVSLHDPAGKFLGKVGLDKEEKMAS